MWAQEAPAAPPPASEEAPLPEPDEEARETIELIRWAIEENDREGARELLREAVAVLEAPAPGGEMARIAFLAELDKIANELGSLQESRLLRVSMLRIRETLLSPDDHELLAAKQSLGATLYRQGDYTGAHSLFEEVLAARSRLLPADHADLLKAKGNLAAAKASLDDFEGALALQEEVLAVWLRLLPADQPELLIAKEGLANTKAQLGDLQGALELLEQVVASRTRLLPADHGDLLGAKRSLGMTRFLLRDLEGANALLQEVFAAHTRSLPADHPELLFTMENLAATKADLGDLAGARELEERVLAARKRLLPADHPLLLRSMHNYAMTSRRLGDLAGACELEERVLAAKKRLLPAGHPVLLRTEQNLAVTKAELGDLAGAHVLFEEVLAARVQFLSPHNPELLTAQMNVANARKDLGDLEGARELVSSLLEGLCIRAGGLRSESPRSARESARLELGRFSKALFVSQASDPEGTLEPGLFSALEELRLTSVASSETARALAEHPELAEIAREVAERRARLNDLVASGAGAGRPVEEWRAELLRLAEERDRAERQLRSQLNQAGVFVGRIDAAAVGARLVPGEAAVSFLRYLKQSEKDPRTGETPPSIDSLLAFLVQPGGTVRRIELGPAAELEQLVQDWREALGSQPAGRGIGATGGASEADVLESSGRRLRERLLDPILARTTGLRTLHVVLDDFLHLVPLDALPLEQGIVGEALEIRNEITLARLIRAPAGVAVEGELTLAGGIDYEAELGGSSPTLDASTPPVDAALQRSGPGGSGFAFLVGTKEEMESISALYEDVFARPAGTLTGPGATKAALLAAASKTRWLHLATHGWFAPETCRSQLDSLAEGGSDEPWKNAEETLAGFAPETLCGLALAGANRGRDALGRVPGILTAEELATFDLHDCELAVLSACETNVGIRRSGQGVQSLQSALHAAGARTAITSLWKVDDAATRRLFELFYAKLWKEKLGQAEALWQAKMTLRAEGHPVRDWGGWVLSGDPE